MTEKTYETKALVEFEEELKKRLKEQEEVLKIKLDAEYRDRLEAERLSLKVELKKLASVPNITTYVLVAFVMVVVAVGLVVLLTIFSPAGSDNAVTIGAIFAFCVAVILQLYTSLQNMEIKAENRESEERRRIEAAEQKKLTETTYHEINSKMTAALDNAHIAGIGEGRALGRKEAEERTDKLAGTQPVQTIRDDAGAME